MLDHIFSFLVSLIRCVSYLLADPAPCPLSNVRREDGVTSVGVFIEVVHGSRPHEFTSVEEVQRLLFGFSLARCVVVGRQFFVC